MKNKVLVAGCGISGIGAARMLLAAGKSVILYDGNDKKNKEEIRAQVADNSSDETLSIVLGTLSQDVIDQSEYCVISPGIPTDLAFVEELKKNGVPIWSEIELAYHYAKGQVIGITGTNGKTTTTALTGEIMVGFVLAGHLAMIPHNPMGWPTWWILLTVAAHLIYLAKLAGPISRFIRNS